MAKIEKKINFEGWFSLNIPESWEYQVEGDLLEFNASKNGKGSLQISFFRRKDIGETLKQTSENHLNRFIDQNRVFVDENTYKVIEAPKLTIANVSGQYEKDFIKVWTVVNEQKMLLITYISPTKTRELSAVEDIVYSIDFEKKR